MVTISESLANEIGLEGSTVYIDGTIIFVSETDMYLDNDFLLYLNKKPVDNIIGNDDIIRFFLTPDNQGAACLVFHLPGS